MTGDDFRWSPYRALQAQELNPWTRHRTRDADRLNNFEQRGPEMATRSVRRHALGPLAVLVAIGMGLAACSSAPSADELYARAHASCVELGAMSKQSGVIWTESMFISCLQKRHSLLRVESEAAEAERAAYWSRLQAISASMAAEDVDRDERWDRIREEQKRDASRRRCEDAIRRERQGATLSRFEVDQACRY